MAFKLTPISCDREGSELRVRGHVLSGAYFGPEPVQDGEYPLSFARDLISKMPGVSPANAEAMAKTLLANLSVEGLKWTQDDGLGWTNNWRYSQRNPNSLLSILEQGDFAYIKEFFA